MVETISDETLVTSFLAGNQDSFVDLIQRYAHKVHNLAMRITRNQEDAEEVLQDVFVIVYRKLNCFEGKSAFSSWLYRITANTSFMKLRKRKHDIYISVEETYNKVKETWSGDRSDTSNVDYISSRHELREALESAIHRLPEEYRLIFVLRDIDGLANEEVGRILKLSLPAVKSRLHRARLMLRKKLQRFYEDYQGADIICYGPRESEAQAVV